MENLPVYIPFSFGIIVLVAGWLFYKASGYSRPVLLIMFAWVIFQSVLGIVGFYHQPVSGTARFPLLVLPVLFFLLSRFFTKKGRLFIDRLNLKTLTIFHVIRIFVEIVLFWLFVNHSIPKAMTFEGRNFDIFSGLSVPVIYYFGFVQKKLGKTALIIWNLICTALLVNVVTSAILSLPARYLHFGFEQPNIAIGYFPFVLLPAFVVPLALFSNLAAIWKLARE